MFSSFTLIALILVIFLADYATRRAI